MKTAIAALLFAAAQAAAGTPLAVQTFDAAWSIIHTTYYDPAFRGVDWNAVRDELRPEAARAQSPAELRGVITRMMARLGEAHVAVLPQFADPSEGDSPGRPGRPGFDVRLGGPALLVTRVDEGSPAWQARLRAGERITALDNVPVSSLDDALPEDLEPRMRHLQIWRAAMMRLRGP